MKENDLYIFFKFYFSFENQTQYFNQFRFENIEDS